jgi:hypothetical protein
VTMRHLPQHHQQQRGSQPQQELDCSACQEAGMQRMPLSTQTS